MSRGDREQLIAAAVILAAWAAAGLIALWRGGWIQEFLMPRVW